jgi:hypothetical protein
MRSAVAVVALAASLSLLSAGAASPALSTPLTLRPPAKVIAGPLLGLFRERGGTSLGAINQRTLRAQPGKSLSLPYVNAWAVSPAASLLALAVHQDPANEPNSLQFVRLPSLRRDGRPVKLADEVSALAWISASRVAALVGNLLCCPAKLSVVVVDARARRVVTREPVPGTVLAVDRLPRGLVVLSAPTNAIGPATVVAVDRHGARQVRLSEVTAGQQPEDGATTKASIPALASDATGRFAYVVGARSTIASVDVSTLAVSYHSLNEQPGRARANAFRAPSTAAKGGDGSIRIARWLGNGFLVVTGKNLRDTQRRPPDPAGLRIVNVRDWTERVLDRGADSFAVTDGLLLATGARGDAGTPPTGIGLKAYGTNGQPRLRLFAGRAVAVEVVLAGRAYISGNGWARYRVVELESRRVIGTLAPDSLAEPILGRGSLPASFGYPGRSR